MPAKKPLTKQQKYKVKMRELGYYTTEVWAHEADKAAIQEFARMLRNKRGYARDKAA